MMNCLGELSQLDKRAAQVVASIDVVRCDTSRATKMLKCFGNLPQLKTCRAQADVSDGIILGHAQRVGEHGDAILPRSDLVRASRRQQQHEQHTRARHAPQCVSPPGILQGLQTHTQGDCQTN